MVTKIQNGTEWNGTVPPTKIRNTRNGTVTEQSGLVVWLEFNGTDHGLLPVNNERIFALQMAKVVYKKEVASMQGEPELVPVTTPRNMKQLRNLHHKQLYSCPAFPVTTCTPSMK